MAALTGWSITHHSWSSMAKYAGARTKRKKRAAATRRARQPLRLRCVFGAWRRQSLRSPKGLTQRSETDNKMMKQ